ncbi:TPA: glycosyltransferase family 32 protein [Streptococcus agalactiae]|uniref:Cps7M n=1 Tax=Streptococcus agalactiae TaxID=1311 RepID=Q67A34_STRAG|nr:glycosyltransferase [Streptococcus agalactiae]AAR25951.1 Cps7M [Streptococcus agalactiae]SIO74097.1 polysaccharide biosynthesis protein CpsM [Streptococcus agalactiae]VEJ12968.1 Polysaccharide biosynthesis protein CpsM(V) [Streptococcus agalactiae]HEM9602787.1 glycosyl transferase [Streptococcus agalactiae]HEM9657074.1 glycosyl transferase [Streptococcus agalactiae]
MIPKVIHYCWFGGNPLPDNLKKYIKTWREQCPDYEIIEWNERNYDVTKNIFMREAYTKKNFAYVSDYARLDIIYTYGGFYLDTDVELLKSLDPLRVHNCFLARELSYDVNTGLIIGAIRGQKFIKDNMSVYEESKFLSFDKTCVEITTSLLLKKGLKSKNIIQVIDGVTIYPRQYFNPKNLLTGKLDFLTNDTYSIHHYEGSWKKPSIFPDSMKIRVRLVIDFIFGYGTYRRLLRFLKLKQ